MYYNNTGKAKSFLWRCIGSRLYVQSLASLVGSTSLFLPLIYLQDRQ